MPDSNIKKLPKKSYLKMIENSVGSNAYRNFYVLDKTTGLELDVLRDGELSCASFVSSILTIFGLIDRPHATVKTVIENLTSEFGWEKSKDICPGDIVIWEAYSIDGYNYNEHIGFALNKNEAISNSSENHAIAKHHITYGTNEDSTPKRRIIGIYKNILI
jgi:hypothetical protein